MLCAYCVHVGVQNLSRKASEKDATDGQLLATVGTLCWVARHKISMVNMKFFPGAKEQLVCGGAGGESAGRGEQDDAGGCRGVRAVHRGHLEQQGDAGGHPPQNVRRRARLPRPTLHIHLISPR